MDINSIITRKLREEYEIEKAERESSGKLSASQLSKPLLEQVLKIIGVPEAPITDYTLRLFKRGKQVEDWVIKQIKAKDTQVEVEYKGVIGYVDAVHDNVPYEIKSVKASQWRWLEKEGARWSHKLQAGLYALALDSESYQVVYVVADDFRIRSFELHTADIKPEIEKVMKEVKVALKSARLPVFAPRESWHEKPDYAEKYSSYPDWLHLDTDLAMKKLEREFPKAYERLITLSKPKVKA